MAKGKYTFEELMAQVRTAVDSGQVVEGTASTGIDRHFGGDVMDVYREYRFLGRKVIDFFSGYDSPREFNAEGFRDLTDSIASELAPLKVSFDEIKGKSCRVVVSQ